MPDSPPLLSVVSPVYKADTIVEELVRRIRAAATPLGTYEIVLVDDRSPDDSWSQICRMCETYTEVRGVRLSRNFGQHAAIAAGLAASTGQFVVVMDCDLQDDPSYIPELLDAAQRGAEVVLTHRSRRRHSTFRNIAAALYIRLVAVLSGHDPSKIGQGSYSLLHRKVVDAFLQLQDINVHYLATLSYLGFEQCTIEVAHAQRFDGTTSYTFRKLAAHALDGIISQSLRVLHLAVSVGMCLFLLSVFGAVYLLVSYFVRGALPGFTSLAVVVLLTTGVILMSIGVVGVYVGRIFEQAKARPRYVVDVVVAGHGVTSTTPDEETMRRHE